jgi:3',5'-cyclic AMP phosphodiesterase CpdA
MYHLGDIVYFNGESYLYREQFYDPYKYYPAPIFAIPGNHDGDTHVQRGDPPDRDPYSLFGFLENFCATQRHTPYDYRDAMTQPYPYWVLKAPFVTIIGLYSNVSGLLDGRGAAVQEQWLLKQLEAVANDPCVIVAVHHPPFSLDSVHGGYPHILDALDRCCEATGVWPHAVLSGHVHNYQRFTREVKNGKGKGREIPYLVAGAGGVANTPRRIHKMEADARGLVGKPLDVESGAGGKVTLKHFNQTDAGFLQVTVTADRKLTFAYFAQALDPNEEPPARHDDTITVDCEAAKVTDGPLAK